MGHVVRRQASGSGRRGRRRSRVIVEDPATAAAAAGTMVAAVMRLRLLLLLLLLPVVIVGLMNEVRRWGQEGTGIAEILVRRAAVICNVRSVESCSFKLGGWRKKPSA